MELLIRYIQLPNKSFFLFGPRGTGKSTWVRKAYPNALLIDLLDLKVFREFRTFPEKLKELVYGNKDKKIFIIDEVQKAPEILSVVHSLIEEKQDYIFVITGSSARKLKRTGVDLLAGRALLKKMHPFIASEVNNFNLEKALVRGMLPLVFNSADYVEDLKTYVALYMKEEVQVEGIVRHIENFGRFIEAISFSQASIINYSNVARDCGVSSKSIENYIDILEDLLLSHRVYIFTKKAKRNLVHHPKFYYFDAGVYRTIRPTGPLDQPEEIDGHALETLIFQHLNAWLDYSNKEGKLYYWRTKSGLEVDFIIYGEIGFYAIEVKNSKKIKNTDLRGLKEFIKDYPMCQPILLYRGAEQLEINQILCVPITNFLMQLKPNAEFYK